MVVKFDENLPEPNPAGGVPASRDELLTVAEIAARLGVSENTVRNHIKDSGLEPVAPSQNLGRAGGISPAQYSLACFTNAEQQQQIAFVKRARDQVVRAAAAVKPEVQVEVINSGLQSFVEEHNWKAMCSIAAQMVSGLTQMAKDAESLEAENTRLNRQLDQDVNTGTLEKFNEEFNWGATATQLSILSRRLGRHYPRVKVISIEHPDGVWSYERKDIMDSISRFPHFWAGIRVYPSKE